MTDVRACSLPDVLAAVTMCDDAEAWRGAWRGHLPLLSPDGSGAILRPASWRATLHPWRHTTPIEAFDALIARGLLPKHWSDPERAPRWWCPTCRGGDPVATCGGDGILHHNGHASLVAVASLGVGSLSAAEALVEETWRARVVWRVAAAAMLRDLMERAYNESLDHVTGAGELHLAAVAWFHPDDVCDALARWQSIEPAWWQSIEPAKKKAAAAVAVLAAQGMLVVDDDCLTLFVESPA